MKIKGVVKMKKLEKPDLISKENFLPERIKFICEKVRTKPFQLEIEEMRILADYIDTPKHPYCNEIVEAKLFEGETIVGYSRSEGISSLKNGFSKICDWNEVEEYSIKEFK
jgi:hypothetical protein